MGNYATVAELRSDGVGDPPSDARLEELLYKASRYIDLVTRMWFEERPLTLRVDGSGYPTLHLMIPIIEVTEVRMDGSVVDPELYVVYNRDYPDDRTNPRLTMKDMSRARLNVFADIGSRRGVWNRGQQNVEIDGTFGYTEIDPGPPPVRTYPALINYACRKLVIRTTPDLADTSATIQALVAGRLKEEMTDGHSYKLETGATTSLEQAANTDVLGLTGDLELDQVLLKFIALRPKAGRIV